MQETELDTEDDGGWLDPLSPPPDTATFELIDGGLRQTSAPPDWLERLKASSENSDAITDHISFLQSFLPEAFKFWTQGRDGRLVSDFWIQSDGSGGEIHLLAYAVVIRGQKLLLICSAKSLYKERERAQRYIHEKVIQENIANRRQSEAGMASSPQAPNASLDEIQTKNTLPGIDNRLDFYHVFELKVQHADELDEPLSILRLEIDHFKLINDLQGHIVGEVYLNSVEKLIQSALHQTRDVVARVGGEEFAVILPGVDGSNAFQLAHTLNGMIRKLCVPNPIARGLLSATVSIGVSTRPSRSQATVAEMLRAAVQALDQAKQSGGDRVVAAPRPSDICSPIAGC